MKNLGIRFIFAKNNACFSQKLFEIFSIMSKIDMQQIYPKENILHYKSVAVVKK
jgi:hypothetical protein